MLVEWPCETLLQAFTCSAELAVLTFDFEIKLMKIMYFLESEQRC